jgi:hypothetical protein
MALTAGGERQRPLPERGGHAPLMGGEQHGGAARPDVLDDVQNLAGHLLVEAARRLVGEEEQRFAGDGARKRRALRLALRELCRVGLCARRQADRTQGIEDARRDLAARRPEDAEHEGDVLVHGAARQELGVLEDDADQAAHLGHLAPFEARHVVAQDFDLSLGR